MKAHNEPYDRCNFFTKVTYEITYKVEYPWVSKSNQFYIYFRKRSWTIINFTYYPYYEDDVVEKVYYFFSRIRPDEPLVIGFTTRGNKTKYYRYADINLTRSTGLPQGGFGEGDVVKNLWNENKKINKKLTFKIGKGNNVHINGIPGEVEPKDNYTGEFKSVFRKANIDPEFYGTPNGSYIFYSDNIFTINKKMNTIDSKIFENLNGLTFYAIYVYYTDKDDIAVLVELIKDFNDTIFIARKNREGSFWEKVEIRRSDSTEFNSELQRIVQGWDLSPKSGTSKPIEYTNHADATLNDCDPGRTMTPVQVGKEPAKVTPRPSGQQAKYPANSISPRPTSVQSQERSDKSKYDRTHGPDDPILHTASTTTQRKVQSSSRTASIESRPSGTTAVRSGPTSVTSGRSSLRSPGSTGQRQTKVEVNHQKSPAQKALQTPQNRQDSLQDKDKMLDQDVNLHLQQELIEERRELDHSFHLHNMRGLRNKRAIKVFIVHSKLHIVIKTFPILVPI
ncbi:hypothetical protein MACJ_001784 [Theileria orientalis]|uniref:Uncharacterized protein n=1 Tax=Theileria orientalis TaxID=68886 RepID=A0A976M505_THEOR|nr:hypothetical protein MACJ_001784 [Theileria orientalis]